MAEQKSRLVIEISSENATKNAEALGRELQKLTEKGNKASDSSSVLDKELKTTSETTKTFGNTTSKATKELVQQETQLNKNGTAVVQLAKYVASYLTISKAIGMADSYTQMAARIRNATKDTEEYALVQDRLYQTANTTYRALGEAQEVYLSMSGGMKSLGYNTAQTLDMTDSLSFAFTANATRADQAQSAMDALSKSMAKGKVDADAWISIVTGADNIIADMAKTTGKTEAEIRQLGATGKVSLSELITTLIQTKAANEALANNMENSFADGMQKLSNATQKFLGELNKTTGATNNLASGLSFLADNVDKVAIVGGVMASIYSGRVVAAWLLSARSAIASAVATASATTAMNTAAVSARVLYAALGGPIGLGIAVAGTAASYLLLKDNTKNATVELDKQGKSVVSLANEYNNLSDAQQRAFKYQEEVELNKLTDEYRKAEQQVRTYASSIAEVAAKDEVAKNTVRELIREFDSKRISAEQLANRINSLSGVGSENKAVMDKHAVAATKAKDAMDAQKRVTDALGGSIRKMSEDTQKATGDTLAFQKQLESLRKSSESGYLDQRYLFKNTQIFGGDVDGLKKAKELLSWRKANDLTDITKPLSSKQMQVFDKYYQAKLQQERLETKITNEVREQTKQSEKQLKVLQLSAQVQKNADKYNFARIEAKNGLPSGMLSALHAIETGNTGKTNQVNKTTGATGGFQFLEGTAKQYGVKDRTNLAQSAEGAAKYMAYLLKLFKGDLEKAVRAYHAGEGNVQKGTNIGKYNNDYIAKYIGYTAGQGGITGDFKDVESYLNEQYQLQLKTQQEIDQLKSEYLTADYKRQQDHEKKVVDLKAHGLNDLVAKENAQYKAETELSKLQFESQVHGWQWIGEEKIKNEAKVNKAVIDASKELGDEQKAQHKQSIDAQAEYELAVFRETQRQKINELAFAVGGVGDQARNYLMERSNPNLYAKNQLSSEQFGAQSQLNKDYQSQRGEIFNQGLDPEEQHAKLLEAEKQFLDSKQALNEMYAQKETDLQQSQYQNQLQIWGSLLSQGQTMWSQLTQSVKDANGEQSGAYKAMFLAQQAFSMGSAYVSAVLASQQVAADATIPFFGAKIAASSAMMAMGMANVGLIAAQTISGMAHDGIDNVPKEGTWLLDKGERVVDSRTNSDLKSYLAKSGGSGGDITIQVNVTDSGVSTQSSNSDKKQLGDMIGNAVRAVIRQEQRQGGMLAK